MTKTPPFVIALDQGSSGSKALAFDASGRVRFSALEPLRTIYGPHQEAEQEPEEIARGLERALDRVLARLPESAEIPAVGLACQRSTVVFWEKNSGRALGRAITWQDGRAAAEMEKEPFRSRRNEIHERTGLYLTPYYSAPKIFWKLKKDRALRRLADRGGLCAGPVASFLFWRWTKGEAFACDPTLAQRMLLIDLKTLDWDAKLRRLFSLSAVRLPKILPSAGFWAALRRGKRTLPIFSCLGDQQAAALGFGLARPGSAVANYGTGAFLLYALGSGIKRVPGLLTSIGAGAASDGPGFFLEGPVSAAGSVLAWLAQNGWAPHFLRDIERLCRESKGGTRFLPALGGLASPYWDSSARSFWGPLDWSSTKADLVRAAVESVAFLIGDIADSLRARGCSFGELPVSGGLSQSDFLAQTQADVLGVPVKRIVISEATALGAALLAAKAAGLRWTGLKGSPKISRIFRPRISRTESARLRREWRRFVSACRGLGRPA